SGNDADNHAPYIPLAPAHLHRLVRDVGGARDAGNRGDRAPGVVVHARRLGVRAERVALDHPQVGAAAAEQYPRVIDHATVDAGHGQRRPDQEPESDPGEDELSPRLQDVATREADHGDTPGTRSTTVIRVRVLSIVWL